MTTFQLKTSLEKPTVGETFTNPKNLHNLHRHHVRPTTGSTLQPQQPLLPQATFLQITVLTTLQVATDTALQIAVVASYDIAIVGERHTLRHSTCQMSSQVTNQEVKASHEIAVTPTVTTFQLTT